MMQRVEKAHAAFETRNPGARKVIDLPMISNQMAE
jgi:hypothetical protein